MSPEVRVEFEYTEAEYIAANRLLFFSASNAAGRVIVFGLLLLAGAIMMSVLVAEWSVLWISLLFVLLLEVALLYNVLVALPRKYFRGDPKFRDRYHLSFSDEGIKLKTTHVDSKLDWSLYTKVIEGNDLYLLAYGKETRMMTAVPKRVFRDREQENQLRDLITRHISDHAGLKSLPPSESEYKPTSLTPPDWR